MLRSFLQGRKGGRGRQGVSSRVEAASIFSLQISVVSLVGLIIFYRMCTQQTMRQQSVELKIYQRDQRRSCGSRRLFRSFQSMRIRVKRRRVFKSIQLVFLFVGRSGFGFIRFSSEGVVSLFIGLLRLKNRLRLGRFRKSARSRLKVRKVSEIQLSVEKESLFTVTSSWFSTELVKTFSSTVVREQSVMRWQRAGRTSEKMQEEQAMRAVMVMLQKSFMSCMCSTERFYSSSSYRQMQFSVCSSSIGLQRRQFVSRKMGISIVRQEYDSIGVISLVICRIVGW